MKAQLKAGAELDFLSPEEFRKGLSDSHGALLDKLGAGVKFIRTTAQKNSDNAGNFAVSVGPPSGFIWSVRALAVDLLGTNSSNIYINQIGNLQQVIQAKQVNTGWTFLPSETVILYPDDQLIAANAGVAATPNSVQGFLVAAIQVPVGHEFQLLG